MIYTVKIDYYATGEGRTQMILIGSYEDASKAKDRFKQIFDPYFAIGCTIEEGINIDGMEHMVPDYIINRFRENEDIKTSNRGYLEYYTSFHMNFA
jgi:hypothetical protein